VIGEGYHCGVGRPRGPSAHAARPLAVCRFDDGCTVIAAANGCCQHARRPL